jgi:aminoglycoside phosphotransferase (APT) family kinase protein
MSEATGERNLNDWIRQLRKGEPLPDGTDLERVERCVRIAARALHDLQRSDLRPDERYTFADELRHLQRDWKLLRPEPGTHAEPVARIEQLQRRLELMAPVDEPLVPAHGEYRHQQLVGDERSLTLIDWDSYCFANPALDAARFLARLRRDAVRCPGGAGAFGRLTQAFREEFLAPRPELAAHLALYEGLQVTKLLLRCFGHASRGEDMTRIVLVLATLAEELLDRAEAARRGHDTEAPPAGRGSAGPS